ncbi:hypothetical protein KP509_33G064800 [Ceratopteris richardii]|uniref:Secreted protein n=1 Tax=Ceratopteris richardii TaxID=49495 RepID=A0A8T2QRY6_CERRI|nr:hypothetical protein KP509_33G064800 [Ceratopteris richardii]
MNHSLSLLPCFIVVAVRSSSLYCTRWTDFDHMMFENMNNSILRQLISILVLGLTLQLQSSLVSVRQIASIQVTVLTL